MQISQAGTHNSQYALHKAHGSNPNNTASSADISAKLAGLKDIVEISKEGQNASQYLKTLQEGQFIFVKKLQRDRSHEFRSLFDDIKYSEMSLEDGLIAIMEKWQELHDKIRSEEEFFDVTVGDDSCNNSKGSYLKSDLRDLRSEMEYAVLSMFELDSKRQNGGDIAALSLKVFSSPLYADSNKPYSNSLPPSLEKRLSQLGCCFRILSPPDLSKFDNMKKNVANVLDNMKKNAGIPLNQDGSFFGKIYKGMAFPEVFMHKL